MRKKTLQGVRICSLNGPRKSGKTVRKSECMIFLTTKILLSRTIYEQIQLITMVQNSCKELYPMVRETVHYGIRKKVAFEGFKSPNFEDHSRSV
jgi:hypothetical protein